MKTKKEPKDFGKGFYGIPLNNLEESGQNFLEGFIENMAFEAPYWEV